MAVTAQQVNELRKQTGAGLMDCKKALTESNGDMDAAIDFLRKKGAKVAELRSGRDANEGAVIAKVSSDNKRGVIVHLSCETDFVAKNAEFVQFATDLAELALENNIESAEALQETKIEGVTVKEKLAEKIGAIGENINVSNFSTVHAETVVPYIHAGNKIGVLVAFNQPASEDLQTLGRDLAMQVAAMRPVGVDESSVPQETKDRELAIAREKALADGKPENILDKIAEGSLKKFYKENTLIHQQFVKDGSKTVSQVVQALDKDLVITDFKRVELGE
jgi:elongation factor Ts